VNYKQGTRITSPPTIAKNLVVTASPGGEYGGAARFTAYGPDHGREVWRPTPIRAREPGNET